LLVFHNITIVEAQGVQLFRKYGIKPYLQPLNQSTIQLINDIFLVKLTEYHNFSSFLSAGGLAD
jgi:hypothetical protein